MDRLSLSRAARQHEGVLIAPRQPIAGPFSAGKASAIDDSGKPELFTIPAGTQLLPDRRSTTMTSPHLDAGTLAGPTVNPWLIGPAGDLAGRQRAGIPRHRSS